MRRVVLLAAFCAMSVASEAGNYADRPWPTRVIPVVLLNRSVVPPEHHARIAEFNRRIEEGLQIWADPQLPLPIQLAPVMSPPASPHIQVVISPYRDEPDQTCAAGPDQGHAERLGYEPKDARHLLCLGVNFDATLVAHEIGHAIGLAHEHQRFDRDEYLAMKINADLSRTPEWTWMWTEFSKYKKEPILNPEGVRVNEDYSYDPFSIMHYLGSIEVPNSVGRVLIYSMTRQGCDLMEHLRPRNPGKRPFGDHRKLSEGDRHTVCKLYPPHINAPVPLGCVVPPVGNVPRHTGCDPLFPNER